MPDFEWTHVVGFGETNVMGNVYFSHYFDWQGACRESFLLDHAPETIPLLERKELAFFTRSASCEYIGDHGFSALDRIVLRMRLKRFRGGRMTLGFTYARANAPNDVVAHGEQEVHCKAERSSAWVPEPFPVALLFALKRFAEGAELQAALDDALEFHASRGRAPNPEL